MFNIEEYLKDLETLVNIDSNSFYPKGLGEIVDAVEKIALRMGLFVKRHKTSELSADYLEVSNRENAERYDIMLMGHLDTVQPVGFAKEHPFSRDDEFAYGPGTCDMKAGALCALYAVKELSEEAKNKLNIALIFNCDEEITSRYTNPFTQQMAKKSDYAFVMESTSDEGTYTIARKGSGTYKIKFHGTPGHSGYIFDYFTANAVVEMSRWAVELHKLNDRENLFSVNVAIANGGKVTNVVPDYAELSVNIRVAQKSQYEIFDNKIKELAANPMIEGVTTEIETISKNYPMVPVPEMDEYLERVRKVFDSIGQKFDLYPIRGGCSDGNIIADAGTRCIDSLGPWAKGGHTHSEYVYLSDIEPCIIRMKALMEEIASQK
ncbi:MAG: M20/M25/M40 family metallo-hydrolase [Clostridia bacterium]|nr:M20/M25/M40 family metallo-hydrolase [Clostridia bacterium]